MRMQQADIEFLLNQQAVVKNKANAVLAELGKQANEHAARAAELFTLSLDLAKAIQSSDAALKTAIDKQTPPNVPPEPQTGRDLDRS